MDTEARLRNNELVLSLAARKYCDGFHFIAAHPKDGYAVAAKGGVLWLDGDGVLTFVDLGFGEHVPAALSFSPQGSLIAALPTGYVFISGLPTSPLVRHLAIEGSVEPGSKPQGTVFLGADAFVAADYGGHCIRMLRWTAAVDFGCSLAMTTLAGEFGSAGTVDGAFGAARFDRPMALAQSADGAAVFVGQFGAVRMLSLATSEVRTVANAVAAEPPRPSYITGLVVQPDGDLVFSDGSANRICRVATGALAANSEASAPSSAAVVCRLRVEGVAVQSTGEDADEPPMFSGLALRRDGSVLATDSLNCAILCARLE